VKVKKREREKMTDDNEIMIKDSERQVRHDMKLADNIDPFLENRDLPDMIGYYKDAMEMIARRDKKIASLKSKIRHMEKSHALDAEVLQDYIDAEYRNEI